MALVAGVFYGITFLPVVYIQDTVAGRVQVVMLAVPSAAPFMQRDQLRALATSSEAKVPGFFTASP